MAFLSQIGLLFSHLLFCSLFFHTVVMDVKQFPSQNKKLFVNPDKSPMVFCLRPCSIKKEVKECISNGGGLCFQSIGKVPVELRTKVIILLPDKKRSTDKNALHTSYVFECVREGKLLPQDKYSCSMATTLMKNEGRYPYSEVEDLKILDFVKLEGSTGGLKTSGNSCWKKLERSNVYELRGRSWQSLKDRYLKHLQVWESTRSSLNESQSIASKTDILPRLSKDNSNSKPDEGVRGNFLANVEAKRNRLSPGLSKSEYNALINDFVTTVQKITTANSKSIHKVLFKCNGNEEVAKYYLLNGNCPEGFHMFSDDEDKVLLKCLLNPAVCDEGPAHELVDKLGEEVVLNRASALIGVKRNDFLYMTQIPLPF